MKKIYVNIWDDFEGFEDGDGGTTTMYIENVTFHGGKKNE